jgi:hypothetical protein
LFYASELFTEENLIFLEEAIASTHTEDTLPATVHPKEKSQTNEIDIFDFDFYNLEHNSLTPYFSGLELLLRTAILIDYRHNHLSEEGRNVMKIVISKKTNKPLLEYQTKEGEKRGKVLTKKYFDNFTNVFEPRHLMEKFYLHFAPEKLEDRIFLKNALKKFKGYEDVAFNKMYKIYVDEDWVAKPLWFTEKYRNTSKGVKQTMVKFYELHP